MLASYRVGSGPRSTLLVHGFLGSGRNLRTLTQRWSERDPSRTFLVPDLTGHGESPPLPHDADLTVLASDVLSTARAQGLTGPLSWVGHSLGGRVGLRALTLSPGAVDDLTLLDISPSPLPPDGGNSGWVVRKFLQAPAEASSRAQMRAALLELGLSAGTSDWLLTQLVLQEGRYQWRIDRAALAGLHPKVSAQSLWPQLTPPSVPVRCIRGANSPYVTPEDVERLICAGVEVHTLEHAGHDLHVDALEPLVELLAAH